jgi:tetratricopeptide (TPR) repeat protein
MAHGKKMSGQIFISYRREESRWSARSLHDRLSAHFDRKQIFMDIDAIALGEDFVKAIETTVAKCDVLIAVIGTNWLISKDEQGNRRLDNPEDFVRMEIGTALKREIRVIPVLVDGALMPRSADLPDDLKSLVRRNALRISDTSFDGDCQRLVATIRQVLEKATTEQQEPEKNPLDAEHREREEKQRREAEQPQLDGKTVPPSPALTQDRGPAQAETPPIMQSQGSATRRPFALRAPVVVVMLLFIVGVIWFAGSQLNHIDREAALVTPTQTPTPTPSLASSDAAFYNNRGWDFYQKKDYDKAISDYTDYIKLAPNDADAYYNRGLAYYNKKEYDEAISNYTDAIKLNPNYADGYYNRGLAYYNKKEYDKAISDYTDAIKLNPNYANAYYNRGLVYRIQGNKAQAQADFNKARQLGFQPQ